MMGKGAITSLSRKQGMNTRGSTEVEIVAADEIISPNDEDTIVPHSTRISSQENILYQDYKVLCFSRLDARVQASAPIISISNTSTSLIKREKVTLTSNIVQLMR